MTDSRNQPELETLDYKPEGTSRRFICQCGDICKANRPPATLGMNSHVIKPETRVNKAEDAGQDLGVPVLTADVNGRLLKAKELRALNDHINRQLNKNPNQTHCPKCGQEWIKHGPHYTCIDNKAEQPAKEPNYYPLSCDKPEEPSPNLKIIEQAEGKLCNNKKEVVRTFTGSIGLETAWRPKGSSTSREDETRTCPDCACTEKPNLKIIEQAEGKTKEVLELLENIEAYNTDQRGDVQGCIWTLEGWLKNNLKHLRKAFE